MLSTSESEVEVMPPFCCDDGLGEAKEISPDLGEEYT